MKKIFLLISLCCFVMACKNDSKKDQPDKDIQEYRENLHWAYSDTDLTAADFKECGEAPCPRLKIRYVRFDEISDASKTINRLNAEDIGKIFQNSENPKPVKSMEQAVGYFIEQYKVFRNEFPESQSDYEAILEQEIKDVNDRTIVLQSDFYTYTGGAHGYGGVHFLNFDAQTGSLLKTEDLVADMKGFTDFVETAFRRQYEVPASASLNDKGFFFEDDKFSLPKNIAFTKESVILIYNPYEAASYADGQLRFLFPKKTVEKWLSY